MAVICHINMSSFFEGNIRFFQVKQVKACQHIIFSFNGKMKTDPLQPLPPNGDFSASTSSTSHRQTVPTPEEFEAPPPYSPAPHSSSSGSSIRGEDVPLQRRRSADSGYEPTPQPTASHTSRAASSQDGGYKPQGQMNASGPLTLHKSRVKSVSSPL